MQPWWTISVLLLGLSLGIHAAWADTDAPAGTLLEAEDPPPKSTNRVVGDAEASGGKAVESDKEWEPLFVAESDRWPEGETLTVWVRHRGGPIQLKSSANGKATEHKWVWKKPVEWTWTKLGNYPRADLGDRIIIIRGQTKDDDPTPTIDCVVLATPDTPAHAPEPENAAGITPAGPLGPANAAEAGVEGGDTGDYSNIPDADAPPLEVSLTIDWDSPAGPITKPHWGVADYSILKPSLAGQTEFNDYLRAVNPDLIRIHHAKMADTWTDEATRSWDVEKIKQAFTDADGYGDAPIMLCIASWPTWLHDGKTLPEEKRAEFVALVGELVNVMADEVNRPIAYWEPLNEKDNNYEKAGQLDELWSLFNELAAEIRKQDPDAKVGGLAFTWTKPAWIKPFLEQSGDHIDFLSWHNYATGSLEESNASVFSKIDDNIVKNARFALDQLAAHPRGDEIETYLNEYNISWTWTTREPRMGNNIGAIFQAMVVKRMAELGVTGATVWHVQDNIYGLLTSDGQWRSPADLFVWGNNHLVGEMATVASDQPDAVEALAVTADNGSRSVLLMVKAGQKVILPNPAMDWSARAWQINADGAGEVDLPQNMATLELPGYSLTFLTETLQPSE